MKLTLLITGRLFCLLIILGIGLIFSFLLVNIVFLFIKDFTPLFKEIDTQVIQLFIFCLLAGCLLFLYLLITVSPIVHLIKWLHNLTQRKYIEPKGSRRSKNYMGSNILYKELFHGMRRLTAILIESDNQTKKLEKQRHEWISGVSHDLKTPLAYIRGYSSMLAADKYVWSPTEIHSFAKHIENKVIFLEELIQDLNTSFYFDQGNNTNLNKEQVEFVSFVRDSVIDIANSPMSQDYIFEFEKNIQEINLLIDKQLIKRAIHNLLANAINHNSPGTKVQISIENVGSHILLTIEDNGRGMDMETLENLFTRYYRGTSTSQSPTGTGLGLALTKQFIEAHHGQIKVSSKLNKGTRIEMILPA
jgi:signal transduction histidine kinase